MAKTYRNIFTGGVDDLSMYCETHSGKVIRVGKARFDDNCKCMQVEKDNPAALREAITYADFAKTQSAYLDKELKTGVSAYYIAIADWFSGPKVLEINVDSWTGKAGQTIRVKAKDNVGVAGVSIVIRDPKGNVVEAGEAVQSKSGGTWWKYTTRSYVKMHPFPIVAATARDLAGNQDSFTIC